MDCLLQPSCLPAQEPYGWWDFREGDQIRRQQSRSLFAFRAPAQLLASYSRNEFLGGFSTACSLADCTSSYKNSADTKTIFGNQIRAPPRRKKKGFFLLFSFFVLCVLRRLMCYKYRLRFPSQSASQELGWHLCAELAAGSAGMSSELPRGAQLTPAAHKTSPKAAQQSCKRPSGVETTKDDRKHCFLTLLPPEM